jgi:uncharacterized membrane protein
MDNQGKRRKKKTFKSILRRRMISGLLVVIPLGITIFILRFLYDLTAGQLEPLIKLLLEPLSEYVVPVLSIILLFFLTYGMGLIASVVIGKKLIGVGEAILDCIPLVKMVYGASKQVVQTISFQDNNTTYKSVVIVDFPMSGMKSLAFVTGKMRLVDKSEGTIREHYRVFVPTTPNPTSGYLEFVPVDKAELSGISVEEALKTIMSAGLVMPEAVGPPSAVNDNTSGTL